MDSADKTILFCKIVLIFLLSILTIASFTEEDKMATRCKELCILNGDGYHSYDENYRANDICNCITPEGKLNQIFS